MSIKFFPVKFILGRTITRLCLLAFVSLCVWVFVRGSMPGVLTIPATPSQGPECALVNLSDGSKPVRCVMLLTHPSDAVLTTLIAYRSYSRIFHNEWWSISALEATNQTKEGAHLKGSVGSMIGTFPFETDVHYSKDKMGTSISWKEPEGSGRNRGSWLVIDQPGSETLVYYTHDVSIPPYPDFLVKNYLLSGLPALLESLSKHLGKR